MSDQFIQAAIGADGGGTSVATLTGVTAGSVICAWFYDGSVQVQPATFTVADGDGTYTAAAAVTGATSPDFVYGRIFYRENASAGTHTITGTSSASNCKLIVAEVGAPTSAAVSGSLNVSQVSPGTATDGLSSGSITVTGAATLLCVACDTQVVSAGSQPAAGTGFTARASGTGTSGLIGSFRLSSKAVSSNSAATATAITGTDNFQTAGIAVLNSAGGAVAKRGNTFDAARTNRPGQGPYSTGRFFRQPGETSRPLVGPISGTSGVTLANATLAATGTLPIAGTTTATLANATLAATGTLPIAGTTSATLANATLSAAGTVAIAGSSAATLADATLAATGTLPIAGTATATLADATLAAAGTLPIAGTTTATLADATLAATGSGTDSGTVAATLADATLSAASTLADTGTLSATLADATLAATGTLPIAAALAATLADAALVADGTGASGGLVDQTLGNATLAATAVLAIAGVSGKTLDDATLSASATVALVGSASITLADCTIVATGVGPGSGTCASAADVWNYLMTDGRTAAQVLMDTNARVGLVEKLLRNKQITDPVFGTNTVFDDDGTTVLVSGDLFEDAAGTQPYRGQGAERRERLA